MPSATVWSLPATTSGSQSNLTAKIPLSCLRELRLLSMPKKVKGGQIDAAQSDMLEKCVGTGDLYLVLRQWGDKCTTTHIHAHRREIPAGLRAAAGTFRRIEPQVEMQWRAGPMFVAERAEAHGGRGGGGEACLLHDAAWAWTDCTRELYRPRAFPPRRDRTDTRAGSCDRAEKQIDPEGPTPGRTHAD